MATDAGGAEKNNAAPAEPSLWGALGPGILFAGAAVGVSHLVQSTRAGANYGLALLAVVLLANLIKYPAFRLGPMYAAATGTSMLEGYRRRGRSALVLYALVTLATMFTVQAAVTFVAAGLLLHVTGWAIGPVSASAGLTAICVLLLTAGRYRWLDLVTKVAVAVFTVATLVATVMAAGAIDSLGPLWPAELSTDDVLFVIALVGWMPSAIDVSVWQSLWTLARARTTGLPSMRASSLDFHVGYIACAVLAVCFVFLGAAVMHGQDVAFDPRPAAFAGQLVDLYGQTLGPWSTPVIGIASLLVMFSTTLAVVDGFPRAIAVLVARWRTPETPFDPDEPGAGPDEGWVYWGAIAVLAAGSLAILQFAVTSLKTLVDIAATASFATAPLLSWLNHRAMLGDEVPMDRRPARWLVVASVIGIVVQAGFALLYAWITLAP